MTTTSLPLVCVVRKDPETKLTRSLSRACALRHPRNSIFTRESSRSRRGRRRLRRLKIYSALSEVDNVCLSRVGLAVVRSMVQLRAGPGRRKRKGRRRCGSRPPQHYYYYYSGMDYLTSMCSRVCCTNAHASMRLDYSHYFDLPHTDTKLHRKRRRAGGVW